MALATVIAWAALVSWEVLMVVVVAVGGFVTGVSDELRAEMLLARVLMAVAMGIAWAAILVVLMGVLVVVAWVAVAFVVFRVVGLMSEVSMAIEFDGYGRADDVVCVFCSRAVLTDDVIVFLMTVEIGGCWRADGRGDLIVGVV